jgi:hypothetical protein
MVAFPLPSLGLPLIFEVIILLFLLIIGIVIIVIIVKVILFVLPGAIVALVVWLFTGSLFWAGVAFLIVAFISIARRH